MHGLDLTAFTSGGLEGGEPTKRRLTGAWTWSNRVLADIKGENHRCARSLFPAMHTLTDDTGSLSETLVGRRISHVGPLETGGIAIHFTDGTHLSVTPGTTGFSVRFHKARRATQPGQPSRRQREYLEFIVRYFARFGVSPAERDIERHFMVSAPSVNQMLKTLERRGLIVRRRDVTGQTLPRSIRVLVELE